MRNQVSNSLLKKGLISFAAASLLTTGAMAAINISTTTTDYTYNVSKTVATKGDKVYVVVTLLDKDGKVDTLSGGNSAPKITLTSLNGKVCLGSQSILGCTGTSTSASYNQDTTAGDDFTNGIGVFTVDYTNAKIGTDTLKFTAQIGGTSLDTGTAVTTILEQKQIDVTVNQAPNDATNLGVSSIIPLVTSNSTVTGVYDKDASSDTKAKIDAGDSFKITVKAYNGTTFTENQTSPITVKFAYDKNSDKDITDDYDDVVLIKEVNGTMTNGVAEVTVPSETLTKSGNWVIYAGATTSVKTSDSDYIAENTDVNVTGAVEHIEINSLAATDFKVATERPFIMAYGKIGGAATTAGQNALTVTTIDKYGNAKAPTSEVKFKAESTNYIFGTQKTVTDLTIASTANYVDYNITGYTGAADSTGTTNTGVSSDGTTKTTNTITVTPTSGASWAAKTVNLDTYLYGIVLGFGDGGINGDNNFTTTAGNIAFTAGTTPTSTTTAYTSRNAEGNVTRIFVGQRFDGNVTSLIISPMKKDRESLSEGNFSIAGSNTNRTDNNFTSANVLTTSAKFKITLKNIDGDTSEFNGAAVDNDTNLTQVSFSKAITNARAVVELMSPTNKYVAPYDYDVFKTSKSIAFTNYATTGDLNVSAASPKNASIGKFLNSSAEDKLLGNKKTYTEVTSLVANAASNAVSTNTPATLRIVTNTIDGNETNRTNTYATTSNIYVLRLKDSFNNYMVIPKDANVSISSTDTSSEINPASMKMYDGAYTDQGCNISSGLGTTAICVGDKNITDVNYSSIGNDTLSISPKGWGVSSMTIPVTVTDVSTNLASITLSSTSDVVLKNSIIPLNVEALNKDNSAYDFSGSLGSSTSGKLFTYLVDKPNNINFYEGNTTSTAKQNGDDVNDTTPTVTDGKTTLFVNAKNTIGDVTVTLKNKTGTVVATKKVTVVDSSAELPSPVSTITTSSSTVSITNAKTADVSITVTKENGDVAPSETITVASDNTNVVTVPATITTDAQGKATLTITAKTVLSSANVTLTIGGISTIIKASVVSAPTMTVSKNTETVVAKEQKTITIANAEGSVSATSSDTSKATVGVVDGNVVITGVAEGSATITVTDGKTTQSIALTVEKGVEPAKTPAVIAGWNLLGNASNNTVNPTSFAKAGETVWSYTTGAGWVELATVAPMQGFWYKSRTEQAGLEFPMTGDGTGGATFTVGEWTLLTTAEAKTLGELKTAKEGSTQAWTYMGTAWSKDDATSVEAGRGFWIK